ncbi:MAG: PSD1 and planctomycete cytochrome C domain-containing protein [Capsulimonadales bacterium]|nr:PSD1 and planctomycete cytochrome C domain-containing protein [Capsulimonadales bacterium]
MKRFVLPISALLGVALIVGVSFAGPPTKKASVPTVVAPDFNREVRPILADHCLKCHGPDENHRKGGLRLDRYDGIVARLGSGNAALDRVHPADSELLKRIRATDDLRMPPSHTNKPLSDAQKDVLRRWVLTGAKYAPHWAFVTPKRVVPPPAGAWGRNPIDGFVLARMKKAGLSPAPEADRYTLIRRVYLDLIGLPPTPEQADAFVRDTRPDAYERIVDQLLGNPHYGERWARRWLDLARYSDTNGYEKDRPRSIYPFRDWVIKALNDDLPFDTFTIKQIAGDLLPNATVEDRIATGFHRNTMHNEEGGNDPLEYRFHAMTDRVATTGTTWLGLTLNCAQCHTHKYDPIPHREYYRLMAFLNNANEIPMDIPKPEITAKRAELEAEIAKREADLPNRFPVAMPIEWKTVRATTVTSAGGATATVQTDDSVLLSGVNPERDTYTIAVHSEPKRVSFLRLETLTDPSLGGKGPGRTGHGNFVLSEITATVTSKEGDGKARPIRFVRAEADVAQDGFPASATIDGKPDTGWAVSVPGKLNTDHTLTLYPEKTIDLPAGGVLTITLAQNYGGQHTLGKFRVRLGEPATDNDPRPIEERRRERFDTAFAAWKASLEPAAVRWTILKPTRAAADVPVLRILPDGSVLSTSDITKKDIYRVDYVRLPKAITALRIEVLPHPGLPRGGPGRVYYEGQQGDFWFNELTVKADGQPVKLKKGIATYGDGNALTDGQPDSGWSTGGQTGKPNAAIVVFEGPVTTTRLSLEMLFERYYASSLGRFRISVTDDPKAGGVAFLPDTEDALLTPEAQRTPAQKAALVRAFCAVAPELSGERSEIETLRGSLPNYPTTLVFEERPADNIRPTNRHHRGEFLQPKERVTPGVLSVLNPLPPDVPLNRLTFARWLVSPGNPLTARVTVNRQWAAFFGRGIVRTTEDFGYQGQPPSHPELLDWLAVEFMKQGWSLKKLHRLIVTSATYRQSGVATGAKRAKDPENILLSWAPPLRLEAELVRDTTLAASGLLSRKIGGPSVFPPQPPGVTTEGAYGPLTWTVSQGEDRYRRGLYTFSKRTAPYAMFATFDAPSGEATCPRREVSNTPLQALTLLNAEAFVEAAQALGRMVAARPGTSAEKAAYLFRRCVTRPPQPEELRRIVAFEEAQKERLKGGSDAHKIAGEGPGDAAERASWTVLARALLNIDEAIVRR